MRTNSMRRIAPILVSVSLFGVSQFGQSAEPAHSDQPIVSPTDAIARLKEGNGRFTAGNPQHPHESVDRRNYMAVNSYENTGSIFLGMLVRLVSCQRA